MAASTSRRKFSSQFKAEAVQLVIQSQRPTITVAEELAINPGTLGNWVKKYRHDNPEPEKKMTPADHGRLAELEVSIRSFGGHSILGPGASDIARGGRQWRRRGPGRAVTPDRRL